MRKALVLLCVICAMTIVEVTGKEKKLHKDQIKDKDMMRKMIIFNKNNPNFFYCPVPNSKHMTSIDKMIVKAVPINRLCEYEGQPIPKDAKRDCFNNVDETEFACKEKYRITLRKYPDFKAGRRLQKLIKHENEMVSEMVQNHKKN